jgi:hypothetical protein
MHLFRRELSRNFFLVLLVRFSRKGVLDSGGGLLGSCLGLGSWFRVRARPVHRQVFRYSGISVFPAAGWLASPNSCAGLDLLGLTFLDLGSKLGRRRDQTTQPKCIDAWDAWDLPYSRALGVGTFSLRCSLQ